MLRSVPVCQHSIAYRQMCEQGSARLRDAILTYLARRAR